ncbi:uncharacterized protein LOC135378953 [Ornithodoros turicata]|uniref:uncharacterized protein LOC135378953 n=1 Tax=Ornithodoros turicata TaxID=34597 RepID=UPI003138D7D4
MRRMDGDTGSFPLKKRKTGTIYCCVVNCHNSVENTRGSCPSVTFHSFPGKWYETARREAWISAVRRENPDGSSWQPTKRSKICSAHFVNNRVSNVEGDPSYVPMIFPCVYSRNVPGAERHKRHFGRQSKARHGAVQMSSEKMEQPGPSAISEPPLHEIPDGELDVLGNVALDASKLPTHQDVGTETDGSMHVGQLKILLSATDGVNAACQVNHAEQVEKFDASTCASRCADSSSPSHADISQAAETYSVWSAPFGAGARPPLIIRYASLPARFSLACQAEVHPKRHKKLQARIRGVAVGTQTLPGVSHRAVQVCPVDMQKLPGDDPT